METIAVYWEPVIKTYGIVERKGLHMVSGALALNTGNQAGRYLEGLAHGLGDLVLVLACPTSNNLLRFHLVMSCAPEQTGRPAQNPEWSAGVTGSLVETAVDLIFLQGPHYGDRYGIWETAFRALLSADASPLAASCCGSCIYLVMSPGKTETARSALSEVFVVPGFEKSKKGR